MRPFLAAAAVLALALGAGTASADTFAVVPAARRRPEAPAGAAERRDAEPDRLDPAAAGRLGRRPSCPLPRALLRGAAGSLGARRRRLRHPLAGARGDQQDRVELRPQHGPELGRCGRLDAVHARYLAALGHGRQRRRHRRPVEPGGRDPLGRALPRRRGRPHRHLRARSSPTTTRSGTSTTSCSSPLCSAATRGADAVFSLDRMALALEEAQEQVASLSRAARRRGGGRVGVGRQAERLTAAAERPRAAPLRPRARGEGRVRRPGRSSPRPRPRQTGSAASWSRRRPHSSPPGAAPSRHRSRPPRPACCGCRRAPTATSSRSAADPAWSPSGTTTTTTPPPTSPRLWARRSTRSRTGSCSIARRRRSLRHRLRAPDARRPRVGLLPPLLP